jgi:lysophospholipase L1-like esterase
VPLAPPRLRRAVIALLAAAVVFGCKAAPGAAPASPPAPEPAAPPEQEAMATRSPPELAGFYRELQRLEAHQVEHVHILQIGDSHTAGDVFSGRLRSHFEERFGDAGRGLMPPGLAFEGLRQKEVKVTQTGRWRIDNSLRSPEAGPYGITGFTARSLAAGARMTVAPTDPNGFDLAIVEYVQHPGGGAFDVQFDGRAVSHVATAGASKPGRLVLNVPPGTAELGILARGANAVITGWSVERRARGVLYESQGVVSATVGLVQHWDPVLVRHDLEALRPALIVLAFGTNEGFQLEFDEQGYAATFAAVLSELKRDAPQASVLIVAPPDGQRVDPACPTRKTDAMACHWSTPSALAAVRSLQRNAAIATGSAYWDWSTMMAGPGGIDRWVRLDPPLARQDHVHFTLEGYELAADSLFGRIMDGYELYLGETAKRPAKRQ